MRNGILVYFSIGVQGENAYRVFSFFFMLSWLKLPKKQVLG